MFNNGGGGLFGSIAEMRFIDAIQQRRDAAISMYRHANIAMPDVHIADRNVEFIPKIVGDDGQELTPERRAELMKKSKPCVDENGRVRGLDPLAEDIDYVEDFKDIPQEVWGTAAVANRPPMRKITPRELELPIEEETLESAKVLKEPTDAV